MINGLRFFAGFVLAACLAATPPKTLAQAADPVVAFEVEVDLGADRGQNFGSLFEARDQQGQLIAGAGFMDVYNTRFRSDRHTLQFFLRGGTDPEDEFTIERLPHPDLDCGVYMFDLDQQLYAWSSVRGNSAKRWDDTSRRWVNHLVRDFLTHASLPNDALPEQMNGLRSGDGVMRLGTGLLVFAQNRAMYNGRQILKPPSSGNYYNFYYAQGRLFFYHTQRADSGGFTKIYACDWKPNRDLQVDLTSAAVMTTKYVGETPFAWGQFRDEVLTVSNQGGVYAFRGSAWRTLLPADNTVSYQVYSMLNYYDRLLLAQYPTGNLFEYRGQEVKHLEGWPPRLPGVSSRAREAQTLAIYRGDLFAGVWPWAELWRYERDADKWHSLGRMFTHPELTDKTTHPYEAQADRYGLVTNHWGQRVTGMVPWGDSLMLSTSAKGTYEWFDKYDFLSDPQRREYGAVIRLKMPGNLAARIEWKEQPTRFEFIVEPTRLVIRQDGKELGACRVRIDETQGGQPINVQWGRGVFGKSNMRLTRSIVRRSN